MNFKGTQQTLHYIQQNTGPADEVFPLLCPERECDWLDGWTYRMIHSESGLIEQDCVFTTPMHGNQETVWQVTRYDPENYRIEFLRVTPGENVVKINIRLHEESPSLTQTHISYRYTALSEEQNDFIQNQLEQDFRQSMEWWEKAINHYLQEGEMLRKQ